jgi:hypothetical protein
MSGLSEEIRLALLVLGAAHSAYFRKMNATQFRWQRYRNVGRVSRFVSVGTDAALSSKKDEGQKRLTISPHVAVATFDFHEKAELGR